MTKRELVETTNETVKMPRKLTAENGAKYHLIGEFFEVVELECTACDDGDEGCEVCSGYGTFTYRVPITWPSIKRIYDMAVSCLGEQQVDQTGGVEQQGGDRQKVAVLCNQCGWHGQDSIVQGDDPLEYNFNCQSCGSQDLHRVVIEREEL